MDTGCYTYSSIHTFAKTHAVYIVLFTLTHKVPVRIKGRMDILHIYEEDKNFSLSKTEVEELVGEYKHSLTLVFGDSSSESEGEQSGGE